MKKNSFFLNILLIAFLMTGAMIGFTSCNDPEEKPDDPIVVPDDPDDPDNPDDPDEPTIGLTVKFGSEDPWTAQKVVGYMNGDLLCLMAYPSANSTDYPCLSMQINPQTGVVEINENDFNVSVNPEAQQYIEYYRNQAVTLNGQTYGDWWVKNGTMDITTFDSSTMTITGTFDLTMFDATTINAKQGTADDVSVVITMNEAVIAPLSKKIR